MLPRLGPGLAYLSLGLIFIQDDSLMPGSSDPEGSLVTKSIIIKTETLPWKKGKHGKGKKASHFWC